MRDFKNLSVFKENQINHILDQYKEKDDRLKPIRDYLEKNYYTEEITEMNNYQIAKVRRKTNAKEWLYATFIDYKTTNEMSSSFDTAVLACLSYKYDGRQSGAVTYIERILGMQYEVEEIEQEKQI